MKSSKLENVISEWVSYYLIHNHAGKIRNHDIDPDVTLSVEDEYILLGIKMWPCKLLRWQTMYIRIPFDSISMTYIIKQVEFTIDLSFGPTPIDELLK